MIVLVSLTILLNLLAIGVLIFGMLKTFVNPKAKALFGYIIAGSMIFYLLALFINFVAEYMVHKYFNFLYVITIISPFIIGKFVKYETLKVYTIIQVLCFTAGLFGLVNEFMVIAQG